MKKSKKHLRVPKCPFCGSALLYEDATEVGCLKCGMEAKGSDVERAWWNFWRMAEIRKAGDGVCVKI